MDALTLLPPLVALIIAVWKRDVIVALVLALICSELIQAQGHIFSGTSASVAQVVSVFASAGNTQVVIFALLIGGLMRLVKLSGGLQGFVQWVVSTPMANSPRRVGLLTMVTGIFVFIESNLSLLTSGMLSRPLFDRFRLSRARLAFIIDSTCAPVSVLILLNAWGAFLLTVIEPFAPGDSVAILIGTLPYNFYAIAILLIVLYTVVSGRVFGPLKSLESLPHSVSDETHQEPKHPLYFLLPIVTLVLSIVFFMWLTGNGNIVEGSGTKSVLWGTLVAFLLAYSMNRLGLGIKHRILMERTFEGMSDLLPVVVTVVLAIALGASMRALGTGDYVSGLLADSLHLSLLAPVTFITAGIIAFTTGTSWGTFSLLTPIAMPISLATGVDPSLMMAAVIGGGVFGDHCSPISDTTIVASLASGVDHFTHVKTQLPYALIGGGITVLGYWLVSMVTL